MRISNSKNKIKIVVCISDPETSNRYNTILNKLFVQNVLNIEIKSLTDPLACIKEKNIDAYLLDLSYPQISGINLAECLKKTKDCEIIFSGDYENSWHQSLKVKPLGFIRKNVMEADIKETVNNLLKELNKKKQGFIFRDGKKGIYISINHIIYMYSDRDYVIIVLENRECFSIRRKLTEIEEKISKFGFLRIHCRYLINLNKVVKNSRDNNKHDLIELEGGIILPISRKYSKHVKSTFVQWDKSLIV